MSGLRAIIRIQAPLTIEVELSGFPARSGPADGDEGRATESGGDESSPADDDDIDHGVVAGAKPVPPPTEITGAVLRERRRQADLTIEALSKRAGVAPKTIQNIEKERHRPTLESLKRICSVTELNLVPPKPGSPGHSPKETA